MGERCQVYAWIQDFGGVVVKLNFWLYIQRYTSPYENFEYSYV